MMLLTSGILFINFGVIMVMGESTSVVNTTFGPVQGEIDETLNGMKYASFKGIRFGKPPLGYLRFKPPVPVEPWSETLQATTEGNDCPQLDSDNNNTFTGNEDCLFLNVFTPVADLSNATSAMKPVMVYIYGGSFVTGSSSVKINHPDFILEKDIVFANMNYRLGALGFLTLNHPNATGNAGLKDQNLALKWIKANIEQFGGNPNNITIVGESAGSVSVGFHVLSDASAGLFHGAISMSGTPLNPWGFTPRVVAVGRGIRFAALLAPFSFDEKKILKTLYSASAEDLVNAAPKLDPITPFTPTLEDPKIATDLFISECSVFKYEHKNFSRIPQILGFMQQETVTFLNDIPYFLGVLNKTNDVIKKIADKIGSVDDNFKSLLNNVTKLGGKVERGVLETTINVTTDLLFKVEIDQTQQYLVEYSGSNPIYYYDITFYTNKSRHNQADKNAVNGAGHADDLAYIFYIPSLNYSLDPDDPLTRTIDRVTTMWTNFARYGNPTPNWIGDNSLNVSWPVSGKSGKALKIGEELTVVPRPLSKDAKLEESVLKPLILLANDCPKPLKPIIKKLSG